MHSMFNERILQTSNFCTGVLVDALMFISRNAVYYYKHVSSYENYNNN